MHVHLTSHMPLLLNLKYFILQHYLDLFDICLLVQQFAHLFCTMWHTDDNITELSKTKTEHVLMAWQLKLWQYCSETTKHTTPLQPHYDLIMSTDSFRYIVVLLRNHWVSTQMTIPLQNSPEMLFFTWISKYFKWHDSFFLASQNEKLMIHAEKVLSGLELTLEVSLPWFLQ